MIPNKQFTYRISPLHMKKFYSESTFLSRVCLLVQQSYVGIQLTQSAM